MANAKLLQEFPPVSTHSWEEAIQHDLKDASQLKKLIWQTEEGLAVKPYYRAENIAGLGNIDAALGASPLARSPRLGGDWRIREEVDAADPESPNSAAQKAVAAGAEEIAFLNASIESASDIELLLAGLEQIPVHFENADMRAIRLLTERELKATVSTGFDPLVDPDFSVEIAQAAIPGLAPFTFHGEEFEESGATAVEEIGFTLAAAIDCMAEMQLRKVDVNRAAASVNFSFAIGANFFFQIAKLRAFRMVWARAVESFGGAPESARARIHARTSRWNKTIYDPHVNILRGTTEAISAILGGADSISVAPFDECCKQPDEASRRLARNTQILLKQEALLSRVADPGAGSYYLEVVTDFLAREGWKRMQNIEAAGGYRKAKADGAIARSLEHSLAAKEKAVASRRRVFVGTNRYADSADKALGRIDASHSSGKPRATHEYEQLRLRTERHAAKAGKLPRVLLAEIGDAKMRAARSQFVADFFRCAGFDIVTQQFQSAAAVASAEADLIVLCSSDPEYPALAAELIAELKKLSRVTPVLVAGLPDSTPQLREAGVADFVHVRSNPLELLGAWQQRLGIKE